MKHESMEWSGVDLGALFLASYYCTGLSSHHRPTTGLRQAGWPNFVSLLSRGVSGGGVALLPLLLLATFQKVLHCLPKAKGKEVLACRFKHSMLVSVHPLDTWPCVV